LAADHEPVVSKYQHVGAIWLIVNLSIGVAAAGHAARSEESAVQAAKDAPKSTACNRPAFRIVVDIGHTVGVPGALSARGVAEYTFNLKLAEVIKQSLVDAGFDNTVLLVTATAPWPGLLERARRANTMHANLFIAVHHDSVPDQLLDTWQYEGRENRFSDRFTSYAIFVSNENAERGGSLAFGHLLGKNLQARGLQYTPHYTLPLMGRYRHQASRCRRRRIPIRSTTGVAAYFNAGGTARSRLHR
jgi:N-acetylmuramoyl-L-alanine amidase